MVDPLREYPHVDLPFTRWCHMAADSGFEELHAFAERLGIPRRAFERDHYDLPPHARERAVAAGRRGGLHARAARAHGGAARRPDPRPPGRMIGPCPTASTSPTPTRPTR